jgi:hypothetical protein
LKVEFALSSPTSIGCFFLDSNIILSEILNENTPRIDKLKKDSSFHNIPCYVSDSVQQESYEKMTQASDFLGTVIRDTMRYSLLENRRKKNTPLTDPMTSDDIKALENLFSYYHSAVRTTKKGLPSPVSLIEEWTITYLGQKLDQKVAIDIPQFLLELVKALLKQTSLIEDSYDDLVTFQKRFVKTKNITPNARLCAKLRKLGIHRPDDIHIASAICHKANSNEETVFVTLDFSSILNRQYDIKKRMKIDCCDPLYALHHLA